MNKENVKMMGQTQSRYPSQAKTSEIIDARSGSKYSLDDFPLRVRFMTSPDSRSIYSVSSLGSSLTPFSSAPLPTAFPSRKWPGYSKRVSKTDGWNYLRKRQRKIRAEVTQPQPNDDWKTEYEQLSED